MLFNKVFWKSKDVIGKSREKNIDCVKFSLIHFTKKCLTEKVTKETKKYKLNPQKHLTNEDLLVQ